MTGFMEFGGVGSDEGGKDQTPAYNPGPAKGLGRFQRGLPRQRFCSKFSAERGMSLAEIYFSGGRRGIYAPETIPEAIGLQPRIYNSMSTKGPCLKANPAPLSSGA